MLNIKEPLGRGSLDPSPVLPQMVPGGVGSVFRSRDPSKTTEGGASLETGGLRLPADSPSRHLHIFTPPSSSSSAWVSSPASATQLTKDVTFRSHRAIVRSK